MTNDIGQIWKEDELIDYMNKIVSNKTNLIVDPDTKLNIDIKNRLYNISEEMAKDHDVYMFLIIVYNISEDFDLDVVRESISYMSEVAYDNAFFILYSYYNKGKNFIYSIGEQLTKYDDKFISDLNKKIDYSSGLTYSNLKLIYTSIRNKYIKPSGGWTPDNLVESFRNKFSNDSKLIPYAYYDPLYLAEYDTFQPMKKYMEDLSLRGVKSFVIAVDNISNYTTDDFMIRFMAKFAISYKLNASKAIFLICFYDNKIFKYKLGLDLGDLNEGQMKKINEDARYFSNLTQAFLLIMRDFRNFVGGEKLGWQASMFNDYLLESTTMPRDKNFIYCKDLVDFDDKIKSNQIIKGTVEHLNTYNANFFIFIFNKIDQDKYGQNLKKFHEDFIVYFQKTKTVSLKMENIIFFYASLSDNNITYINIGSKFSGLIDNDKVNEIIDKSHSMLSQKYLPYQIVMYVLRASRFHLVIKNKPFTPEILACYFNDIYDYSRYKLHDPNNTLNVDYMYSNKFEDYFNEIFTAKTSMYLIILNNIDKIQYPNENETTNFITQLGTYFSSSGFPTSKNLNMFIAVYFSDFKKFDYYKGANNYKMTNDRIEEIKNEISKMESFDITKASHIILKYTRYYTYISGNPWSGKAFANVINDFIGKPDLILFDSEEVLGDINSIQYYNILTYINELNTKIDMHTFLMINKNNSTAIGNGDMSDEFEKYFILPDGLNKTKCFFIILNTNVKKYDYKIGSYLEKYFNNEMLEEIINEECSNNLNTNIYYGLKCLISTLRLYIYTIGEIEDIWSYNKLNDFIYQNYKNENSELTKNYFFFDYYFEFTYYSEKDVISRFDKFYSNKDVKFFLFILDEINEDGDEFIMHLYNNYTFTDANKSNIVFLLYSTENKTISSVTGKEIKNLLTDNNWEDILKRREMYMKINVQDGVSYLLDDIENFLELPKFWSADYLAKYVKSKSYDLYLGIIDPYINLNSNDNNEITSLMKKIYLNKVSVYAIILPYLDISMDQYLKNVKYKFPIPVDFTSDYVVFIIKITSTNELGLITQYDTSQILNDDFINKIKNEAINKNLKDGLIYLNKEILKKIEENDDKKSKSTNQLKFFKILATVLGGLVILFIIIAIVCRNIRKSRGNFKPIDTENNIDKPKKIFGIPISKDGIKGSKNLLDNVTSLEDIN